MKIERKKLPASDENPLEWGISMTPCWIILQEYGAATENEPVRVNLRDIRTTQVRCTVLLTTSHIVIDADCEQDRTEAHHVAIGNSQHAIETRHSGIGKQWGTWSNGAICDPDFLRGTQSGQRYQEQTASDSTDRTTFRQGQRYKRTSWC